MGELGREISGPVGFALHAIRGDRARDGIVETAVEHVKIVRTDRRVGLSGHLGDDLADVSVAVHDLRNRETVFQ